MKGNQAQGHFSGVKAMLLCGALSLTIGMRADETQDRRAIGTVIAALNDPVERAALFTKDADSAVDFDRLADLHKRNLFPGGVVIGMDEPWTGMTVPRVVGGAIRFITPDVAIVDGASTVDRAITLARRVPLLFVLKRERAGWRISAVRVLRISNDTASEPSRLPFPRWAGMPLPAAR